MPEENIHPENEPDSIPPPDHPEGFNPDAKYINPDITFRSDVNPEKNIVHNETYVQFVPSMPEDEHKTTDWEFRRFHNKEIAMRFSTDKNGVINMKNFARVKYADKRQLLLSLDRKCNYEVRFRENDEEWSEWNYIEVMKELRKMSGRLRKTHVISSDGKSFEVK